MADAFTLETYNVVFRGNPDLQNERFHAARLHYTKMNFEGLSLFSSVALDRKQSTIRNEVVVQGIDQFNRPFLYANPETNWNLNLSLNQKVKRFNVRVNATANWFTYTQTLNGTTLENSRYNQSFRLSARTAYRKYPNASVGYTKRLSRATGLSQAHFQSDHFSAYLKRFVSKKWLFSARQDYLSNRNNAGQRNSYATTGIRVEYQKKHSPWRFSVIADNVFDNEAKISYSFSDYLISEQAATVLPRIVMASVNYRF